MYYVFEKEIGGFSSCVFSSQAGLIQVDVLFFLIVGQWAAGGAGLLRRLGNSNDQWGEWTAPTLSLRVTEAEGSKG